jgi:predicted restriction endonuclease
MKSTQNGSIIRRYSDSVLTDHQYQKQVILQGKNILETNDFLKSLDKIMKNEEFRSFYQKYFKTHCEMETSILYMKLYENLENEYKKVYQHEDIPPEVMAFTLREIFSDKDTRKAVMNSFDQFCKIERSNVKEFAIGEFCNVYKEKRNQITWEL